MTTYSQMRLRHADLHTPVDPKARFFAERLATDFRDIAVTLRMYPYMDFTSTEVSCSVTFNEGSININLRAGSGLVAEVDYPEAEALWAEYAKDEIATTEYLKFIKAVTDTLLDTQVARLTVLARTIKDNA